MGPHLSPSLNRLCNLYTSQADKQVVYVALIINRASVVIFHQLLPISRGSCCRSDCAGTISVSAITNETIPLFQFFFSSLPPSFSSLHYAGSLTLFDRMCYLQPPAAVPLSLSLHRWQLNPTAACHGEARGGREGGRGLGGDAAV